MAYHQPSVIVGTARSTSAGMMEIEKKKLVTKIQDGARVVLLGSLGRKKMHHTNATSTTSWPRTLRIPC